MSTVIGIFEDHLKRKTFTCSQESTRRFTHIDDTINVCYLLKKNLCRHYSISTKILYNIRSSKAFNSKIKFLPKRAGERYASALSNKNLSNKIFRYFGKISLKKYIQEFVKKNQ